MFLNTPREAKYLATLGVDKKLIFLHICETRVDYFVERKIKRIVDLDGSWTHLISNGRKL